MSAKNISGQRFGKLLVLRRSAVNNSSGAAMWECICDCGSVRVIAGTGLRAGRHKSCGCVSPRFTSEQVKTHGMTGTRTHRIWVGMHERCSNVNATSARLYAVKGIRVCDRWGSFENFLADMGECPPGLTIERRSNAIGYCPENCLWATRKVQGNNTSRNRVVEFGGAKMTVAQWAETIGLKPNTLLYRLRRGWSLDRALNLVIGKLMKEYA